MKLSEVIGLLERRKQHCGDRETTVMLHLEMGASCHALLIGRDSIDVLGGLLLAEDIEALSQDSQEEEEQHENLTHDHLS